ncbi:MAG: SpoIIIAH-like family protein, partial [Clostridiaceae bacterium]|nr:SpoIIIAH-like family protein [Clostridiaceae bacterium]
MKVLKRNQVIVLVIALMLVSAGYLNFASIDNENKQESTQTSVQESTIEYA